MILLFIAGCFSLYLAMAGAWYLIFTRLGGDDESAIMAIFWPVTVIMLLIVLPFVLMFSAIDNYLRKRSR